MRPERGGPPAFASGGELFVCGREKNVIVIRGANHHPQEFEECLTGVDGVRAGCAVALGFVPEGENGEQLLILAERARSGPADDGRTDEQIVEAVVRLGKQVNLGPAYDKHTGLGPVVNQGHKDFVLNWIEKGIEEGAELILDGRQPEVPPGCEKGFFVAFDYSQDALTEIDAFFKWAESPEPPVVSGALGAFGWVWPATR